MGIRVLIVAGLAASVGATDAKYTDEEVHNRLRVEGKNSIHAEGWIQCSRYVCPEGIKYNAKKANNELEELTLTGCATGDNVFSKFLGGLKVNGRDMGRMAPGPGTLKDFCIEKGYQTVGRMWRAYPQDFKLSNMLFTTDDNKSEWPYWTCNNMYEFQLEYTLIGKGYHWPLTWECTNEIPTKSKCCTEWTPECYAARTPDNNYHACASCGPPPGPCYEKCGRVEWVYPWTTSKMESEECKKCCQEAEHETAWNCDGEHFIRCKDIKDDADLCKAQGHCKAKVKKGVLKKCKARKCKKAKTAEKCREYMCEPKMEGETFMRCDKKKED